MPHWLSAWERSEPNSEEDQRGIDFTLMTDVGKIFLQVKSSKRAAREFKNAKGHRHIVTCWLDVRRSNSSILNLLIWIVGKHRDQILLNRAA